MVWATFRAIFFTSSSGHPVRGIRQDYKYRVTGYEMKKQDFFVAISNVSEKLPKTRPCHALRRMIKFKVDLCILNDRSRT
jgi:hypothetical protein